MFRAAVKRLTSAFTVAVLLLSSLITGAGGAVLCFGTDGHIAVESTIHSSLTGGRQTTSPHESPAAQKADVGLATHHAVPCADLAVSALKARSDAAVDKTEKSSDAPNSVTKPTFNRNFEAIHGPPTDISRSQVDPTLRVLRTVILLT